MNQYRITKQWKKIISWLLIFCLTFTSIEWPIISNAENVEESIQAEQENKSESQNLDEGEENSLDNNEAFFEGI